jgi:hypothetical protein
MQASTIRRIGLAAVLLLSAFALAQEGEKKPEEKKPPASKGKAPSKTPPAQGTPGARPQNQNPPPTQNQTPTAARPNPAGPANTTPPAGGFNRGGQAPAPNYGARTGQAGPGARPVPQGSRVVQTQGGGAVTMRANGRPAVVHASNGVEVHHGLTGRTEVIRESPDHSRVVAIRGGGGYVQSPYVYGGHPYLARTYMVGGRPYQSFYRGYPYHGVYLEVYAPVRYYPVGFYGYVATPWARPVPYTWGWVGTPWFTFYGGYFTPYPVYAAPPLWLTDYLIAQSLNAAYQAQMAQGGGYAPPPPPPGGQVAMTPQVKQAIADEVQRQLALENAEARSNAQNLEPDPAASGIARMLSDNQPHVFVVGDGLDLLNAAGQECAVTEGDVLQLAGPPPPDSPSATLIVMASKGGLECRTGSSVSVALNDLQDMQNHMRQTLDAGLADLQSHQGGLPTPPQTALAMATPAAFSMGAPPPDPSVATQIDAQLQQGTQLEQQTLAEAGSAPGPGAPPPAATTQPATIALGQTTDQVVAILGQPTQVVDLGAKKIYVYPSLKITFNNGQVADVE